MDALASSEIFLFEGFRLDRRGGGLFRCDDGKDAPIEIGARALDILGVLVARAGEVVSKDEIIAAVWSGKVVEDSNLTVQISALRRVLDQGPPHGSCIQTIAGRGYRFVRPVMQPAVGMDAGMSPGSREPLRIISQDGVKPLLPLASERPPELQPSSSISAERRQLTVMICDLVGAATLASRLDPEDLQEIITAYHRAVGEIVAGFDGFVSRRMGDTVLACFGYPTAHEDDAERAVRAGLAVIEAIGCLDFKAVKVQTRVGIATGLVVVSDGSAQEQSVTGETPYLANRLKAVAEPDTVVIAASTHRLTGGLFEYRDLGTVPAQGIAAPVQARQVLCPSGASRFEALRGSAITPLVGREEEIDVLLRRWGRAKAGRGQVVLISGEPGIGKSRVVVALAERPKLEPHIRLRFFCSPYHQDSALLPVIEQLGHAAGFARDDPPSAKLEKLEVLLAAAAPPDEDVALVADLLSLPASERHPLPNLRPQRKKERILEALIRQLEGLARQQPVVMVFEDAHWIDPTSRELLDLVIERVGELPVLLVVTCRPEFQPPWTDQPQVTTLMLNRLDRHDRTALVKQIAGSEKLSDEVVAQIADRTDGVPLFIEELTKSALESGVSASGVPTSLQASLMARLDHLGSARRLAQIGAAIGREFPYALLRSVSRTADDELQGGLSRIVGSGLVFQRGTPPDAVYAFKHALVQDAAHSSLLKSARQQLHAAIAQALETHFPELIDSQPELFAQHYAEAGFAEKSIAFWGKAGRRSAGRSAMAEAAAQFQKGLDQLALLPETPERRQQELEFHSSLGAALISVKGMAAPETGKTYVRARELWEQLGSPSEFLNVPYGQYYHHASRGEFNLAQSIAEGLLRFSSQRNDSAGLVLGHLASGRNLMFVGWFVPSRSHLEEVVALYDPSSHGLLTDQMGTHPRATAEAYLGVVLFCLGYPDQAMAVSDAAISEAGVLAHPPSLALSLTFGALVSALVGDDAALGERTEQLATVSTEQGFPHWHAVATMLRGWIKVKIRDVSDGTSLLRSGIAAYRATGAESPLPYAFSLLARACEIVSQIGEGLASLDEAFQIVERTGERWFAAELNRQQGQLLLRQGHTGAAEELYRKALSIAKEQMANLWELRAAESLARLRCDQGARGEAYELLAPVYGWFTEGFDTPDLTDAKALLEELKA